MFVFHPFVVECECVCACAPGSKAGFVRHLEELEYILLNIEGCQLSLKYRLRYLSVAVCLAGLGHICVLFWIRCSSLEIEQLAVGSQGGLECSKWRSFHTAPRIRGFIISTCLPQRGALLL